MKNSHLPLAEELKFSKIWATDVDPSAIDVVLSNTACTAPELRYIHSQLGNIKGKRIADFGCGLGEASIYFALRGARVTVVDISPSMLSVVKKLAKRYKVEIETHRADVEHVKFREKHFDIIYMANVFHHIRIKETLQNITQSLSPDGTFVCWDPVRYNLALIVYRHFARSMHSKGEHPLGLEDIRTISSFFGETTIRWFWLTSLAVFFLLPFRGYNPNKVRYWKRIVQEGEYWKGIYQPLEMLDRALLSVLPILGPLCWNVVIIGRKPHTK